MEPKKLLLVDDDPVLRVLVSATLRSHAYEILEAPDGETAVEVAHRERPLLAILDYNMPGIDGVEVCRRLKQDPETAGIVVILLTASQQHEAEALAAGARAYLTKPFSPLQLLHLAEEVMAVRPQRPAQPAVTLTEHAAEPAKALAAFLFADLRNFTGYTSQHGDQAAFRLTQSFYLVIRQQAALHAGREVKTEGDSVLMVFPTSFQAVQAAAGMVAALDEYNATHPDALLKAGFGLDVGEPVASGGDYIGASLNRASRLTSIAEPGDILVSGTVRDLAQDVPELRFVDLGPRALRGFDQEQRVYRVARPGASGDERRRQPWRLHAGHAAPLVSAGVGLAALVVLAVVLDAGRVMSRWSWAPADQAPVSQGETRPGRSFTQIANAARPFTIRIVSRGREAANLGTGVIYDSSGLALTNAHVVADIESVEVYLEGGGQVPARVLGRSPDPDLAVLELPGGPYPAASFGDSTRLQAGEEVVAVGYPLAFTLGSDATVTRGIISKVAGALGGRYVQIDAAINPGDSGGPLLNMRGEVIGIVVSRIESVGGRQIQNISLAIPSDLVRETLPRLEGGAGPSPSQTVRLQTPEEVLRSFHRLLYAGEYAIAYGLGSERFRTEIDVNEFAARYGYPGRLGVEVIEATVTTRSEDAVEVSILVAVSRLEGGEVKRTYVDERWRLVPAGAEWKVDRRVSSTTRN